MPRRKTTEGADPPEPEPQIVKLTGTVAALSATVEGLKAALADAGDRDDGRLVALERNVVVINTRLGEFERARATALPSASKPAPGAHDHQPSQHRPERERAAKPTPRSCALRGATDGSFGDGPGFAWIASDGGQVEKVSVGQRHRCLGTVRRVVPDGDGWVVVGSERTLRMGS